MIPSRNSERGQSMIILALALIGLLGFTALAVDGGMAYNERRLAQSAADAASLAGARAASTSLEAASFAYEDFPCSGGTPAAMTTALGIAETTAINRATSNTYTIDDDLIDNNGVTATPGCVDYVSYVDKFIDVRTMVTRDVPMAFVQLFLPNGLRSTVESVARLRPRTLFMFGYAVVALKETCDNSPGNNGGVTFSGSNTTTVTGGGVYSNACMKQNGSPTVNAPSFVYRSDTGSNPPPGADLLPPSAPPLPLFDIDPPNCSLVPVRNGPYDRERLDDHNIDHYAPGRYTSITTQGSYSDNKGTKLELDPGLYCLSNGAKFSGGLVEGDAITIYITGGSFETSGGAEIHLSAPEDDNVIAPAISGVLIYMREGLAEDVVLTGNSTSTYTGLVYAPSGTIEAAGGSVHSPSFNTQLVAGTVKITGNAIIDVHYDKSRTVYTLPLMDQHR